MPDNRLPGMLEDFVAFLVPNSDTNALWQLAAKCLQEAQQLEPQIPLAKGHIHTWLAWQIDPGTPLGLAITKKYLDADAVYTRQLVEWLNRLFN